MKSHDAPWAVVIAYQLSPVCPCGWLASAACHQFATAPIRALRGWSANLTLPDYGRFARYPPESLVWRYTSAMPSQGASLS